VETVKCLWCGRLFMCNSKTEYRFCDRCISKIEDIEEIVKERTGVYVNLCKELEIRWSKEVERWK